VLTSHVSTGDQGTGSGGTFELRVPARQLQATLADLSKLGHMTARSESGQDMTAPYSNVQSRLGNALLERRTLLLRLKHAKGARADGIRSRLASVNADINTLAGQMQELRRRTVYSTVDVTLEQQRGGAGAGGSTGAAFKDALHTLQALANFLVRALGVLLPLALLGGAAALGTRTLRRRRREAALM
jgi:TolA-binding protein